MSTLSNLLKVFLPRRLSRKSTVLCKLDYTRRKYTDKPSSDQANNKQKPSAHGAETESRMRVRRARPADVPRVLRYFREHVQTSWPGYSAGPRSNHVVVCDYVARALAQGHSMLAEQLEARRGWSQIRGLALSTCVCAWDANVLEKWARCIKCPRARRLVHFTAFCLRAPGLHDKYSVHKVLQVFIMVPPNTPKSSEIIQVLVKNAIQRGRDVGFPLLRFDVTDGMVAESMEQLQLRKEWHLSYEVLPDSIQEKKEAINQPEENHKSDIDTRSKKIEAKNDVTGSFISVYTVATNAHK